MTPTDHGTIPDAEPLAAAADLGTALRELMDVSVTTTVAAAEVRAAAELVRQATERLAVARRAVTQLPALDDPSVGRRVFNPVIGVASPIAPPLQVRSEDGDVVAEAAPGPAYEGPPTFLHGGVSALFMDQLLGEAARAGGHWGMTVHLELDYRRPVPLLTPLVMRAAITESSGRKAIVRGTIALADAPDEACVEASAVFVMPRQEKAEAYFGAVTDATGDRPTGPLRADLARD